MLKSFVEYLIGLGNTRTEEIGNQIYSTQPMHKIKQDTPEAVVVRNLSGLVDYLQSEFDKQIPIMVHVESPTEVVAFTTYNRDYNRNFVIRAKAMLPSIPFERFLDPEQFNILLQSCFVSNEHRAALLRIVGNIKEENVHTVGDDGISQQVTAKTGVATVGDVIVPNPVALKPFRTFVEVTQPQSEFIFRMKSGPNCALFEADGGAWKLDAMESIKEYLTNSLEEQINEKKVAIIA